MIYDFMTYNVMTYDVMRYDVMFQAYVFFLRGGSQNSKFSQFQIFPKLDPRGGHQISNFSQIQKSPKHPGGRGDQENCGLFPLFVTFFN